MRQVLLFIFLHIVFGGLAFAGYKLMRLTEGRGRMFGLITAGVGAVGLGVLWFGALV